MTGVQRTVTRTLVVLLAMFVFAFALVPLYDAFCRVTGINGKILTGDIACAVTSKKNHRVGDVDIVRDPA